MEKRREEKNMGTGTIKYSLFGVCIAFMFLGAFAGVETDGSYSV